jgi:hypothetical protein
LSCCDGARSSKREDAASGKPTKTLLHNACSSYAICVSAAGNGGSLCEALVALVGPRCRCKITRVTHDSV